MCCGQYQYQDACFTRNGRDQLTGVGNFFPETELYNSITNIKKVIGYQDDIIGSVCQRDVVVK